MFQANSKIRFKLTEKNNQYIPFMHKGLYTHKKKSSAQESKNKTEYPNMHFILCLDMDTHNSFVFYWNEIIMMEQETFAVNYILLRLKHHAFLLNSL